MKRAVFHTLTALLAVSLVFCSKNKEDKRQDGPEPTAGEFVDLGLSVSWASCNLGASKPYNYGDYYAWAETLTYYYNLTEGQGQSADLIWKELYRLDGYVDKVNSMYSVEFEKYDKYTPEDGIMTLEAREDAAVAANKGRMPTREEFDELMTKCRWVSGYCHGVPGRYVYGIKEGFTDKCIFLPSSGSRMAKDIFAFGTDGSYWSSSLTSGVSETAANLHFNEDVVHPVNSQRCSGMTIRPVKTSD